MSHHVDLLVRPLSAMALFWHVSLEHMCMLHTVGTRTSRSASAMPSRQKSAVLATRVRQSPSETCTRICVLCKERVKSISQISLSRRAK